MINIYKIKEKISAEKVSKKNPIYNSSMYWSQKAYNITDILIEELTNEGDLIFDPFMGSGVTVIEAVSDKYKRNAIGSEINEVPIFMTRFALDRTKEFCYERLIDFSKSLSEKRSELYGCLCPICSSKGEISSIIFDKEYRKINKINFVCSNKKCKCKEIEIADKEINRMYGYYNIDNIVDEELIYNSKIAVSKGMKISNIFTPRNFKALDLIIEYKKNEYRDIEKEIDYILLSMIHLCKITDTHSNSQWPLWTPKTNCVEKNVFMILDRKIKKFKEFIDYKRDKYSNVKENTLSKFNGVSQYKILSCGTQNINNENIEENSVDLIITDPPYMGQVLYSEYMQLYKPFLGYRYNLDDEIVVSSAPSRDKKEKDYFELLQKSFEICGNKLKNHHYLAMYFHDCNLNVWNKLIKLMNSAGFEYISQIHVDKTNTLKNILSPKKSLNGDSILFFLKNKDASLALPESVWKDEIEVGIVEEAKNMLSYGALTTPELYDNGLMEIIIQNGWLEPLSKKYKTLVEIFEKYFIWESITGRWKL